MLLDEDNNVLLSDLGIAIIAHREESLSSQIAIGTPPYMAPEHFERRAEPRSDQYSLGIVVYEWLCGTRPFLGPNYKEQHQLNTPVPPHERIQTIPSIISNIILQAIAKDPKQRFSTVKEFADTLEAAAKAGSTISPERRISRRTALELMGGVVVTAGGYAVGTLSHRELPPHQASSPVVTTSPAGTVTTIYQGHTNAVYDFDLSPKGDRIASASKDHTLQVWEVATKHLIYTLNDNLNGNNILYTVAWSPDGSQIITNDPNDNRKILVIDTLTWKKLPTFSQHSTTVLKVVCSPDSQWIASSDETGIIYVWNMRTGKTLFSYTGHQGNFIFALAWSPDGMYIASGSEDKTVQVWKASDGSPIYTYNGHTDNVRSVAWSHHSNYQIGVYEILVGKRGKKEYPHLDKKASTREETQKWKRMSRYERY